MASRRLATAGAPPEEPVAGAAPRRIKTPPPPPVYGVGPVLDTAEALDASLDRLQALDPEVVSHMLAVGGRPPLRRRQPGFEGLAAIIVSQQVSTASADAIFGRLRAAVNPFEPARFAAIDDGALRVCGLSIQKVRALRAIAVAVGDGTLPLDALAHRPAEDAARALVAVKGIGPWTADIFLLFCLGHPDAWPAGDLALQEAARIALKLDARPDKAALDRVGERWRPHRGAAAHLLWGYYRAVKRREGVGSDAG